MPQAAVNTTQNNMMRATTNSDSVDVILASKNPIIQECFSNVEKLTDISRAEADARFEERKRLRGRRDDLDTQYQREVAAHQHSATALPKELTEKYQAGRAAINKKMNDLDNAPRRVFDQQPECELYIKTKKNLEVAHVADPDFDGSLEDQLEKATGGVEAKRKELVAAESAPRTEDIALKTGMDEIDALAKAGEPGVDALFFRYDSDRRGRFAISGDRGAIKWPKRYIKPGEDEKIVDALAVCVWANKSAIKEAITAKIKARKIVGMSPEDKAEKVSQLHAELADAIRREDRILYELEKRGTYKRVRKVHPCVLLRLECDPRLIAEYEP